MIKPLSIKLINHMMILPSSGWDPFIPLCGKIFVPFKYVSSLTTTSSAMTVSLVTLHQLPTVLFQPIMLPSTKLEFFTMAPARSVEF